MTTTRGPLAFSIGVALLALAACAGETAEAPDGVDFAPPKAGVASSIGEHAGLGQVVGTWDLELTYEGQKQSITLIVAAREDGTLTGTWIGPHRTNELTDFTWNGRMLTFTRNVNREGRPVALRHRATVEGDTMSGIITAPEGELPFSATRSL